MDTSIDAEAPGSGSALAAATDLPGYADLVEDQVIEDLFDETQLTTRTELHDSPSRGDADDHLPDFVSLLSLLDAYFDDERFPTDGKTPRVLEAGFPSLNMQGSPLGHGRTFCVWRLHYKGSVYAVKQARLAERTYKGILRLILVELRVLTLPPLISHENIVSLVGYGWEYRAVFESNSGILPYLIIEHCEHGSLAKFLSRGEAIGQETRKNLILDVARGILALHEAGIVHCDVRCENVLICSHPTRGYVAKITDFGEAVTDVDDPRVSAGGGQPPVSYPCCAPEAFGFVKLENFRFLDIYSYGILALSVLLGMENPFAEFFSTMEASEGSPRTDENLEMLGVSDNIDIQHRVADVKARGLTEASMLWLLTQPKWAERLDVSMARAVVTATLKAHPQARDLYAAAMAVEQSLRRPNGSADTGGAGEQGGLASRDLRTIQKDFHWQPSLTKSLDFRTFPLAASKKYMLDLEARCKAFTKPEYIIMLANYSLHGFGSGSLLPQPESLGWLALEATIFDGDSDPSMWFRVWRYFEALGLPLPNQMRERERTILSAAAMTGSVVAMQALRKTFPERYWDISHEVAWEMRGLAWEVSLMASNIATVEDEWLVGLLETHTVAGEVHEPVCVLWEKDGLFQKTQETMLHAAAAHGRLGLARQLLFRVVEIDAKNVDGQTPLFQACRGGHVDLVEMLLEEGADATVRDVFGETCLHSAFAFPPPVVGRMVDLLVGKGAEVNALCQVNPLAAHRSTEKSYCPGSPLHRAVHMGNKAAAVALLRNGADPWLEAPEWGRPDVKPAVWIGTSPRSTITPIQLACKLAYSELLDTLLDHAPPPTPDFDCFGYTLVCSVDEDPSYGYYLHGKNYLKAVESVVSVLKNHGADFTRAVKYSTSGSDPAFLSALAYATWANRLDLTKALVPLFPKAALNHATQFSISPRRWYKPLHHAIKYGNEALCRILLTAGASCHETEVDQTSEGVSFIGLCVGLPNAVALATLLADHGAAIDIGLSANLTPLFAAVVAGQLELADFLISRGADIHRRIDHDNLLRYMLKRLDEPTEKQLLYALDNMGANWDTFVTSNEIGCETSVFMDVAALSSKDSNTIRWLARFFLEKFPGQSYLDYHTTSGINAVDLAIEQTNFDACEIFVGAGALQDDRLWAETLRFAVGRIDAPLPDEILRAGDAAVKRCRQDRELVLEIFLPRGKSVAQFGPNGEMTIYEGRGPARGKDREGG